MTPTTRREVVGAVIDAREGVSERAVCGAMGWARTSMRYSCRKPIQHPAVAPMLEVALAYPAWGYRRVLTEVRSRGVKVSKRHFHALYRDHRLGHRRRKVPRRPRPSPAARGVQAAQAHDIWAIDFMSDQLVNRQRFRLLVVIDEFTRELIALRAARSFAAADVVRILDEVRRETGRAPSKLRSDNGPEFIADELTSWRQRHQVEALFSRPGKPVDNAICESNNGRIRAEFLNTTLFKSLPDVAEKAEEFRLHFNQQRRHSAIHNMTPAAYAAQLGLSH